MRLFFHKWLDTILAIVVWQLVSLPIHELGHEIGARLAGLPAGYATYNLSLWQGRHNLPRGTEASDFQTVIWFAGGGVFTALLTGLLWWRARTTPTRWDLNHEMALAMVWVGEAAYAVGEATRWEYKGWLSLVATLGAMVYYIPQVWRWLEAQNGHESG
mgnify:CR=1 FL=1